MFSWFTNIFHALNMAATMLILGAALGVAIWLVSRVVTGLTGLGVAAGAGALMLLGVYWTGVIDQLAGNAAKQEIADLKAEKAKLEHDFAALQTVRDFQDKQATEQAIEDAKRDEQYQAALAVITKHADDPNCGLSSEELDAITKIK